MTAESLGARIRELRLKKGWTQLDLSEYLEINRGTVARYETGRISPSKEILAKMCVVFSVSDQYLRTGQPDDDRPECKPGASFRLVGRPKDRCVAYLYPVTLAKVKALARDYGVTIPEAIDQIVDYAIQNLNTEE